MMVWVTVVAMCGMWSSVAVVAGAASGCQSATTSVRAEVRNLAGCDTEDAKAILGASADVVAAVSEAKAGGDKVAAMVRVIADLAVINEHWKHCKATASSVTMQALLTDARASPMSFIDAGIDASTLAELLAR